MADRRAVRVHTRVSPAELADWRPKAAAVGVPLSDLLRQAMARTRTWTAAAAEVERERTRQVARIGSNLNQLARWANRHASAVEAVEVIANLVAFERELHKLTRIGGDGGDAHQVPPAAAPARPARRPATSSASATRAMGREREGVEVLGGDPDIVAAVADSLDFEHKYRSIVIAWAPEDRPTGVAAARG